MSSGMRAVAQRVHQPPAQRLEVVVASEQGAQPRRARGGGARRPTSSSRSTMSSELPATRARKLQRPCVAFITSWCRKSRTLRSSSSMRGMSRRDETGCGREQLDRPGDQQVHAVDLALRAAPADRRTLDGSVRAGAIALRHAEAAHRPPERAEHLPALDAVGIDALARDRLVAGEQVLVVAEAADRQVAAPEAPRVGADPAQVAHRVADVRGLPVEHGDDAGGRHHDVAVAEVVVHQRRLRSLRGRRSSSQRAA